MIENLTLLFFEIIGFLMITLLFLFLLAIKCFLQFEIFTYVLLLAGVIFLIYGIINIKNEPDSCIIGIMIFMSSLFSRVFLWKYDEAVNKKDKE